MKQRKVESLIKIIKWIIIPWLLFVVGLLLSFFYIYKQGNGLLFLVENHSTGNFIQYQSGELLAGDKIKARFKALDNNLGTVSVRFRTFYRINDDFLTFRIKEDGAKDWYYEGKYKVDQFQPNQLFPFGFPIVKDSENKNYLFEIESTKGEPGNAVAIDLTYPAFISKYKFPKADLLGNKDELFRFSLKKSVSLRSENLNNTLRQLPRFLYQVVTNSSNNAIELRSFLYKKAFSIISDLELTATIGFYFLPFVLYLLWVSLVGKYFAGRSLPRSYLFSFIPIIVAFLEIFLLKTPNDLITFGIAMLWFFVAYIYKFGSRITLSFALLFLLFAFTLAALGQDEIATRIVIWVFILMSMGIVQQIWEFKKEPQNRLSLTRYYQEIVKELKLVRGR